MKSIHELIPDIYEYVGGEHGLEDRIASDLAANVSSALQRSFGKHERRGLRLSGLGPKCPCALWYEVHHPELAEPLPPYARIKYAYGHVIEHMIIGLAKATGHDVKGEQDEINLDGILGHRDCIIDGAVVDVKSAATRSFLKFRDKTIATDDSFGYLDQVDGYVLGCRDDPLVLIKDRGYLLAMDKQLGHLALYEHEVRHDHIQRRIRECKEICNRDTPPPCDCGTEADGESGNIKLDLRASYNSHKFSCASQSGRNIRIFLYSDGPRFLTKVVRRPKRRDGSFITEVDKHGKIIYNN